MSSFHPESSSQPPGSQEIIFSQLSIAELGDLQKIVSPRWRDCIIQEKAQRDELMEDIFGPPQQVPETKPYDQERGAQGYLDDLRTVNRRTHFDPKLVNYFPEQKEAASELADQAMAQGGVLTDGVTDGISHSLALFARTNLQAMLISPRVHAYTAYDRKRTDILKQLLPPAMQDTPVITPRHLHGLFNREELAAIARQIKDIPFATLLPDFFQLPDTARSEVTEKLYQEIFSSWKLLRPWEQPIIEQASLAFWSLDDVRETVKKYPSIANEEAYEAFLTNPASLDVLLKQRHTYREAARRAAKQQEGAGQPQEAPKEEAASYEHLEPHLRPIMRLLDDKEINPGIAVLDAGDVLPITPPNDRWLPEDLDRVVSKHIELLGRLLRKDAPEMDPQGPILFDWGRFNVGEVLRGGYRGKLQNLTLSWLPLSTEQVGASLSQYRDSASLKPSDAFFKIFFGVELKSSGIKPKSANLQMILSIRKVSGRDRITKYRKGLRADGEKARRQLAEYKVERDILRERQARHREAWAMIHPLRTGLHNERR